MGVVGGGDDHPVGPGLFEHPLQVVGGPGDHSRYVETGVGQPIQVYRQPARIRLDQPDQLRIILVITSHGVEVHLDPMAGSDHHIASLGGHRVTFRELKKREPR